jgi:gas vesicle protein
MHMKEMLFFVLGAVVGATVALMFAPASGAELRAQIQTTAERDLERLQSEWENGLQKTNEKLDKLQADLKQALQQSQSETEEAV